MAKSDMKPYEERMEKAILALEEEFNTIRVGRANPHILDKIMVDYYGSPTPLQQVGNITVPEARLLVIQPWDASMIKKIEKAIRLVFPELTEEKRKEQGKEVKKRGEAAKVAVRNIRRDGMDAFKKQKKDSDMTEDDLKGLEKEMQDLTDRFIKEIDSRIEKKTKEVMSV